MAQTPASDLDPLCFAFVSGALLVRRDGDRIALPSEAVLQPFEGRVLRRHELGPLGAVRCVAVEFAAQPEPWEGYELLGLRALYGRLPPQQYRMAGRAAQILEWDRAHRFCGACGTPTEADTRAEGHVRRCPACERLFFPRLSPAVIVRIARGRDLLLARSPHFPDGMYSTVAGFVEPGETLEEAVVREVREEVGVEIADLRYFGSQPWPFPHSVMIGFTAEYAGGELRPDPAEIEDAGWFAVDALPLVPASLSIARGLIDDFVRRHGLDPSRLNSPV